MTWSKKPNVAMFGGADWRALVKKVSHCTPEQAKRIAMQDPNISFFFFCREYMVLVNHGSFSPGDAVFFSGEPWYGSAPQCDAYQKENMTIVYIDPNSSEQFKDIGSYSLADGSPAIDVVCIFAGNYASNEKPYLRAQNNNPPTTNPFNSNIQKVLEDGSIKALQDKGVTVLLSITNGHSNVGWSQFQSEVEATEFASYLKTDIVDKYGLDGIDIDDEYSTGAEHLLSLAMVTSIMQNMMPDKIISKALFSDFRYFGLTYNGKSLANTLTYGWEMTYGSSAQGSLPPYVKRGMAKNKLSKGFWSGSLSSDPTHEVQWIKDNGYEGIMVYAFQEQSNVDLMGKLVNALYGSGNWNKKSSG